MYSGLDSKKSWVLYSDDSRNRKFRPNTFFIPKFLSSFFPQPDYENPVWTIHLGSLHPFLCISLL